MRSDANDEISRAQVLYENYFGRLLGLRCSWSCHIVTPKGVLRPALCNARATHERPWVNPEGRLPRQKLM